MIKIKNRKEKIDPTRVRRYRIEYYENAESALFLRTLPKYQMSDFLRNAVKTAINKAKKAA